MDTLKPLPIGIQTFRDIIEGNYLYVDKTEYLYKMLSGTKGVYFLSRPRRFGKSLLLSTLKEIFEGNKELFKGLWLYESDYNWQKYPVLRFDFSTMKTAATKKELEQKIISVIRQYEKQYAIELEESDYDSLFKELLLKLSAKSEGGKVVILIDEYDAPIIRYITETEKAAGMRDVLKGFYTIIKAMDEVIRFVLLTGVSKFSKAGVFSGLNNLEDLTMSPDASSMLGITEEEIGKYLSGYVKKLADFEKVSADEARSKLRLWYNGYCFSKFCEKVYNPFSLFLALKHKNVKNYWFETGTPTFLVNLIKAKSFSVESIPLTLREEKFITYEVENLSPVPLLFQTGYLTIKEYIKEDEEYVLDYPNREVKNSFIRVLLDDITQNDLTDSYLTRLKKSLKSDDIELFFEILSRFFVDIPYDIQIKQEKYYQSIFFLIFQILGFNISVEVKTDKGRIDAVVETDKIYIFEFKLKGTKEEALEQIKTRGYYEKYRDKGKPVYLIGARFNPQSEEEEYFDWVREEL